MRRDETSSDNHSAIRVLTLSLILTTAVLAWLGASGYRSYRFNQEMEARFLRTRELRGVLVHLDEVLTMSAHMAAATGEAQWEKRYRHFEPQLDAAIREAAQIAPQPHTARALARTNVANYALEAAEDHVFALARARRLPQARALLQSNRYTQQKRDYALGMTGFLAALDDQWNIVLYEERRRVVVSIVSAVTSAMVSLVAWMAVGQSLRRSRAAHVAESAERGAAEQAREAALRALNASEERLGSALRAAQMGAWDWDIASNKVVWSEGLERLFGFAPHTFQGTHTEFVARIHPLDRAVEAQTAAHARKHGIDYSSEFRIALPDGCLRWIAGKGRFVYDDAGEAVRMQGTAMDVTERKQAEEELRRSEEFLRRMIDSSADCIKVLDLEGQLLSMNERGQQLLEIEDVSASCLGLLWFDFWQGADREAVCEAVTRARAGNIGQFQGCCPTAKGTPKWWDVIVTPILDAAGKPERLLAVSRDITERKRAEHVSRGQTAALTRTLNALTAKPELDTFLGQVLDAVAEQLPSCWVSLWFSDAASDILWTGDAGDKEQVLFEGPRPVARPQPLPDYSPSLWRALVSTRRPLLVDAVAHDERLQDRDWLLAQGVQTLLLVPLLLGDQVIGVLSIHSTQARRFEIEEIELAQALAGQAILAVQLTRLAEQEQQAALLQERNRMAEEIHDTLAQGFTGIVVQLEAGEYALAKAPEQARAHLARARDLARESLTSARRSVLALRPQALEHSSLALALADRSRQMTEGSPTQAHVHVDGAPFFLAPEVEDNLMHIGLEALTNALKHARAHEVRIALHFAPGEVCLSVEDNGEGFDPHGPAAAAGFGLTSMRARAERIGGRLTINARPGRGTQIVVAVSVAAFPGGSLS